MRTDGGTEAGALSSPRDTSSSLDAAPEATPGDPLDAAPEGSPGDAAMDVTIDDTPPTFAGVVSAVLAPRPIEQLGDRLRLSDDSIVRVSWSPASDDTTSGAELAYRVFAAKQNTPQDYATPVATSEPGATTLDVTGLDSNSVYEIVVRAVDAAGNEEANATTVSLRTLVSFADDVQPIFDVNCNLVACHIPPSAASGLNLEGAEEIVYAEIVDRVTPTWSSWLPADVRIEVTPGAPESSTLFLSLSSDTARLSIMPPVIADRTLTPNEIETIRRWIEEEVAFDSVCFAPLESRPADAGCDDAVPAVPNGDFESGLTEWVTQGASAAEDGSGGHFLRFSCGGGTAVAGVEIPAGAAAPAIRYRARSSGAVAQYLLPGLPPGVVPPADFSEYTACLEPCDGCVRYVSFSVLQWETCTPPPTLDIDDVELVSDPSCMAPDGGVADGGP